jgi:hypothetical protein
MTQKKASAPSAYRFALSPQDSSLSEAKVRKLLAKATADAVTEARKKDDSVHAQAELEGGFGGIGELAALLIFAAKSATGAKVIGAVTTGTAALGTAVATGAGTEGGKFFFNKYLKPRLLKLNVLPSKFRATGATAPKPAKKRRKRG